MKYTMTSPCDQCPFLDTPNMRRGFTLRRLKEFASSEFPCHQTASSVEDEDGLLSITQTIKAFIVQAR